jgi:hypothetical protein
MATFEIVTFPAKQEGPFTSIAITDRLTRTLVECKMDELPAKLKEAAEAAPLNSKRNLDMPHIHAWAKPVGRAPNGFKAFQAARKHEYNHIPAPAAPAVPAGWDKIEA